MGAAVAYGIEKSSANRLPPLDGTISLPCLDHKASIKYDEWGIPHIYAESRTDAFKMQGFVTAQHRCFQLVQTRLAIHGQLSSIIGEAAKPADIFSRTCNFRDLGIQDWEWLCQNKDKYKDAIDMVSSYVQGINAWLSHNLFEVPVELSKLILNYKPKFWKESDVMSVGRLMGIKMSPGWVSKIVSTLLIQTVGKENAEWFCLDSEKVFECPYNDTEDNVSDFYLKLKDIGLLLDKKNQPILGLKHSYFNNKAGYTSPFHPNDIEEKEEVVMDLEEGGASNAFVTLNVPNPFLSFHITVESKENEEENIQFTGVQAVGMPAIAAGHTEFVAMGITVGACDTADIFVERFEDEKSDKYEVDGKFVDAKIREEVIKIKGEDDYILRVRETSHGPVLEVTDYDKGIEKGPYSHLDDCEKENEKYFLRYSLCASYLKPRSEIIHSPLDKFAAVLNSKRMREVIGHFKTISFPNMNYVLADTAGDVGWSTNGLIPIRKEIKTYTPSLPQPGWLSKYDWNGYIPAEQLPSSVNPKRGYVVSCNNNMTDPDKYPYFLGSFFVMGYRAKRATQLIDEALVNEEKITMAYMKAVQLDVHDLACEELITNVLKHFDLDTTINKHTIQLSKWALCTLNSVIPKIVRDGVEVKMFYYNKPNSREKAQYACSYLSFEVFQLGRHFSASIKQSTLFVIVSFDYICNLSTS